MPVASDWTALNWAFAWIELVEARRPAKTSCCGPVVCAVDCSRGESEGHEAAETGSNTSERERILHGLLAAGGALVQPDLNYPWVMKRLWLKKLRKTLRRYYSFPFWEAV